jgi:hypothetical protein
MMGADAGLHADEAGRQVGKPGFELPARQLAAQDDGAAFIEADEMEGVLADVDARCLWTGEACRGSLLPLTPVRRGVLRGAHRAG